MNGPGILVSWFPACPPVMPAEAGIQDLDYTIHALSPLTYTVLLAFYPAKMAEKFDALLFSINNSYNNIKRMSAQEKAKMMNSTQKNSYAAIFLDRDGTIIEDRGDLKHISQVVFFDETVSSLQRLSEFFRLFIVTNQSGVAKGVLSLEDVKKVNEYIMSYLADYGITIVETYVCPHARSDNCACIKPKPFFMKKAAREHNIDLLNSYVIGDHPHDVDLAKGVRARGIYVLTGHGMKHRDELTDNTSIARGIGEATELIIKDINERSAQERKREMIR